MASRARVRMSPAERREQLLDIGVAMFAHRNLDEVSIDEVAEAAGASRGLLYHYFGGKQGFRDAVVRRVAADFVAATATSDAPDPLDRLMSAVSTYVDYVDTNHEAYLSLVRAAAGGDPAMKQIYDDARSALTERILDLGVRDLVPDSDPQVAEAVRLLVRGWQALAEEIVLAWKESARQDSEATPQVAPVQKSAVQQTVVQKSAVIQMLTNSISGLLLTFKI